MLDTEYEFYENIHITGFVVTSCWSTCRMYDVWSTYTSCHANCLVSSEMLTIARCCRDEWPNADEHGELCMLR